MRWMFRAIFGETRATLQLALPLMVAQMAQLGMTIVDNIMVGRLGPGPLAGLAIAHIIFVVCFLLGIGILSAIRPFIAEAYGSQQFESVGPFFRQGMLLCLPLTLIAVIVFLSASDIFRWAGQEAEIIPYASQYLHVLIWGMPAIFAYICIRQLTEGSSNAKPTMYLACAGVIVNIPLNYVFIFGHLGFPALGIQGAALTTVVIHWCMLGVLIRYLRRSSRYRHYELFSWPSRQKSHLIPKILRLGIPLAGVRLGEVGFFLTVTLLMGWFGTIPLAAHQIALNAASFTFMLPLGLSLALTVRVAQAVGRNDAQGVRLAGWVGFLLGGIVMIPGALIFWYLPDWVSHIYTNDPRLFVVANELLIIAALFQIFDGLQTAGVGILQGLRDTRIPFFAIVIAFWLIGTPIGAYLAFQTPMGPRGLWIGMVIALGVAAVAHVLRFTFRTRSDYRAESLLPSP